MFMRLCINTWVPLSTRLGPWRSHALRGLVLRPSHALLCAIIGHPIKLLPPGARRAQTSATKNRRAPLYALPCVKMHAWEVRFAAHQIYLHLLHTRASGAELMALFSWEVSMSQLSFHTLPYHTLP